MPSERPPPEREPSGPAPADPLADDGDAPGGRFFVEFEGDEPCPLQFAGDPTVVLFFISWAYSVQFGGQHELAQAALHIERAHGVDLKPLLRYADRAVEDEADRLTLERAWQPAAPLAASCRAAAAALASDDEQLRTLTAGYEQLPPRLLELAAMCDWGDAREARVRLSFHLDEPPRRASRPATPASGPFGGPPGASGPPPRR